MTTASKVLVNVGVGHYSYLRREVTKTGWRGKRASMLKRHSIFPYNQKLSIAAAPLCTLGLEDSVFLPVSLRLPSHSDWSALAGLSRHRPPCLCIKSFAKPLTHLSRLPNLLTSYRNYCRSHRQVNYLYSTSLCQGTAAI